MYHETRIQITSEFSANFPQNDTKMPPPLNWNKCSHCPIKFILHLHYIRLRSHEAWFGCPSVKLACSLGWHQGNVQFPSGRHTLCLFQHPSFGQRVWFSWSVWWISCLLLGRAFTQGYRSEWLEAVAAGEAPVIAHGNQRLNSIGDPKITSQSVITRIYSPGSGGISGVGQCMAGINGQKQTDKQQQCLLALSCRL